MTQKYGLEFLIERKVRQSRVRNPFTQKSLAIRDDFSARHLLGPESSKYHAEQK